MTKSPRTGLDYEKMAEEAHAAHEKMLLTIDLHGVQAEHYRRHGIDIDAQVAEARKRQKK